MFKQTLPLVAALALGCASSSQYERGAYTTPVRAPAFDPMTDAPHTTGQPGYVNGQRVERSPNRRYVEPSREPQMMAADGDSKRTIELILSEDVPEETPEGIRDSEYAKCWKDIQRMMQDNREWLLKFSPEELRCMRYKVISHCGARQVEKRFAKSGRDYDSTFENERAEKQQEACGDDKYNTRRVVEYGNKFMRHGDKSLGWRPTSADGLN